MPWLDQSPKQRMMEFLSSVLLVLLGDPQALLSLSYKLSHWKTKLHGEYNSFLAFFASCSELFAVHAPGNRSSSYQSIGQGLGILRQLTWLRQLGLTCIRCSGRYVNSVTVQWRGRLAPIFTLLHGLRRTIKALNPLY